MSLLKTKEINQIFEIFSNQNPKPETELNFHNNFTLLVAVVLSAQATDIGVNKATKSLFKIINSPKDVLNLGEEKLKDYVKTIGLFNSKAKNIMALSQILEKQYSGIVPDKFDDLVRLPGVGEKTANVVLNCAFGKKTIAVDTHVFRVSNRIGLVNEKTIDKTAQKILKKVPIKWQLHAHHWLILHGRYICTARKVKCNECLIKDICKKNKL
ncbi:endonuclease III [Rickettsiales bacterium]|nr:endonuclease III [Rickettsiales bacterium]MDB2550233.1 endonuclease III [Rickettsiales bacterium]